MASKTNLIIISSSNGKNLELSKKFFEKSNELKITSEILDLTELNIPLYNPRIHSKNDIPSEIFSLKNKLFEIEKWIICAPEYNGSIPPILSNFIAWLSISGDDFRNLFNYICNKSRKFLISHLMIEKKDDLYRLHVKCVYM